MRSMKRENITTVVGRSAHSGRFVSGDRVFSDVKVPGLGNVRVIDRGTYEKAARKAGSTFKTTVRESGKRTK